MRIGLCGTVSVGKSTLVKELAKLPEFKDYHIATERSEYLRNQGISLNTDSTLKGQIVFAAERSIELMKDNLIADRTIYDVSAFTLSAKSIDYRQKQLIIELLMELRNEYDVIFYVSPEGVEIEDNGVRETNAEYRSKIDYAIQELLKEFPPKKLVIIKGPTEDRIKTVLTNLS